MKWWLKKIFGTFRDNKRNQKLQLIQLNNILEAFFCHFGNDTPIDERGMLFGWISFPKCINQYKYHVISCIHNSNLADFITLTRITHFFTDLWMACFLVNYTLIPNFAPMHLFNYSASQLLFKTKLIFSTRIRCPVIYLTECMR